MVRARGSVPFGIVVACSSAVALAALGDACAPYGETAAGGELEAGSDGVGGTDGAGGAVGASDASDDAPPLADGPPCAACPRGTPRMLCVDGACVETRRVFVTSQPSSAALGGTLGADIKCEALAKAAGFGGAWKAWLSANDTSSPNDRFERSAVPYRLLDGRVVATDWDDLTDGVLNYGIDLDERGNRIVTPVEVWTGTSPSGRASAVGCDGFISEDQSSKPVAVGLTGRADESWTHASLQFCDRVDPHLYCFEQ